MDEVKFKNIECANYTKQEWAGKAEFWPNSVSLKGKNWRVLIQDWGDHYRIYGKSIYRNEIPDIKHPFLYVEKIRGNLYHTFRKVDKEAYQMQTFFMHRFFEQQ